MTAPSSPRTRRRPALEKLNAATDELLYAEGIQATGVQRILEHSGVARGTLYGNFAGKGQLIEAYLERRHHDTMRAFAERVAETGAQGGVEVFRAVMDVGERRSLDPGYRGCAFALAVAEMPEDEGFARRWALTHKSAVKDLLLAPLVGLVAEAPLVAEQLMVLYDGALLSAALRPGADSFDAARAAGEAIIERAAAT